MDADAGKENAAPDGTVELQQILKSYGDFERCDRWNRESAPIDEDGVLAALSAAFAVGDKVVIEGLKAKPKYNGKAAVVRGRVNARGRFPVTVEMRDGPETIALKLANLRAADE